MKEVRKGEGTKPEMVGEGGQEHEQQAQEKSPWNQEERDHENGEGRGLKSQLKMAKGRGGGGGGPKFERGAGKGETDLGSKSLGEKEHSEHQTIEQRPGSGPACQ